ncbi:MAG: F420-dependent NADP oxidoreductase [Flavobacteriaceae bacterium]|nr:F420-dependent NADP oxidoreductase [Flavobacteriaceae bacterium]
MISVVILGSGNLATHLTQAFLKADAINVTQVYSRNIKSINHLKKKTLITDNLKNLKNADVYIISITDDAIENFSKKLNLNDKLVVHTSGSIPLNSLKGNSFKGVFYPLQTFSKDKSISFKNIPICIESDSNNQLIILDKLAAAISNEVFIIDSKQREKLHLSAVFVNNFVNHLYEIGNSICMQNNVPFEILQPLIKETAKKIIELSPKEAQTGPAKRNDTEIIEKHLTLLTDNQKEIYKLLSASIINTHK